MASTNETGHAKNAANFQDLIAFVTGYGAVYNPSKATLKLPQLTALKTATDTKIADVILKNTTYNNKVNERVIAFSTLKTLSTRLISALEVTNASPQMMEDAKGFNRKIQGQRAKSVAQPTDPNVPAPTTISSSQLSYDQLIQHFSSLIAVLQSEPSYTPNEIELKITTLNTKLNDLIAKNNAVATAYTNLSVSRIARNTSLYGTETGIIAIAADVKKYVKSIYGAQSAEFAQIKGIEFIKLKK